MKYKYKHFFRVFALLVVILLVGLMFGFEKVDIVFKLVLFLSCVVASVVVVFTLIVEVHNGNTETKTLLSLNAILILLGFLIFMLLRNS